MRDRNWKKNARYVFYLHILISWKKWEGGSALNIFSIFYTHHRYRILNKHMMPINFDTITNNYEVIYVIKTVIVIYYYSLSLACALNNSLLYPLVKLRLLWCVSSSVLVSVVSFCCIMGALRNPSAPIPTIHYNTLSK